jgi:hypothetical protein
MLEYTDDVVRTWILEVNLVVTPESREAKGEGKQASCGHG